MNIIELKNITFSYENEQNPVLKDFNLKVKKGECVVIEGDNGAGKTTLFRILNGLSFAQSGEYYFNNQIITKDYLKYNRNSKLFHKQIGYLFQNPDLMLFNGTVYDEVAFGPRQMGLTNEEVQKRTQESMSLFDIENLSTKAPYHLSGGQKKRVALAAVISLNPDVLILDEPFAGLDSKSEEHLIHFLKQYKSLNKTIFIATHRSLFKEKLADRIIQLVD